ncbi:peritrophin-1-like [Sabethes cyaneus]|uniref:peritrophin-1-like n=1 Tax=Sabethes cyaneus TaxID=53552 RepID=UPI00237DB66C|nr:peritrophin-1-like [Sabethes cyaneus]
MKTQTALLVLTVLLGCCYARDPRCPESNDPAIVLHFSHPTDCSKYLTCNWGTLVEQQCPSPLLWNDDRKFCDHAFNVNCGGSTATTAATSTAVPSQPTTVQPQSTSSATPSVGTTSAPIAGKCPEKHDPDQPIFLPHSDCTKFYICSWGGAAVEKSCPLGLHWNVNQNYCDYPEQAGCGAGSISTVSTEGTTGLVTGTTAAASSQAPYPDECPPVYDPNHQVYFPHADCTKYYICTYEGTKLEQSCPPTLHWAQHLSYCDRPEAARCQA